MSQLVLWGVAFMVAVLAWRDHLKGSIPNWLLWVFLTVCYAINDPVLSFVFWGGGLLLLLVLGLTELLSHLVSRFGVGPADFYVLTGLLLAMPLNVWVLTMLLWSLTSLTTMVLMKKGERLRAIPVLLPCLVAAIILYSFGVI